MSESGEWIPTESEPYWDIDDLDRIDCENMEKEDLEAQKINEPVVSFEIVSFEAFQAQESNYAARLEKAFKDIKKQRIRADVAEARLQQIAELAQANSGNSDRFYAVIYECLIQQGLIP